MASGSVRLGQSVALLLRPEASQDRMARVSMYVVVDRQATQISMLTNAALSLFFTVRHKRGSSY